MSICSLRGLSFTLLCCTSLYSSFAFGQAGPLDGREQRLDRREVRDDREDIRDDKQDLRTITRAVEDWHVARATGNRQLERSSDDQIKAWLLAQQQEDEREMREARKEGAQAEAERGRSRREAGTSLATANPVAVADDTHDLRNDRRDVRDDREDARSEMAQVERMKAISQELRVMQPSFDSGVATPDQYSRKSSLLRDLQSLANTELAGEKQEKKEDKVERREDRRERVE